MRQWTNPDVNPGGWNDQCFNAAQFNIFTDLLTVNTDIAQFFTYKLPPNARTSISDIVQSYYLRRFNRIDNQRGLNFPFN